MSLSFHGKRPGPGMRADTLSLQFAMHETDGIDDVLEAYERLILDTMLGDSTLFTRADEVEEQWLLVDAIVAGWQRDRPAFPNYPSGSWGPNAIHQLIAPNAWRLPFERARRDPNPLGSDGWGTVVVAGGGRVGEVSRSFRGGRDVRTVDGYEARCRSVGSAG